MITAKEAYDILTNTIGEDLADNYLECKGFYLFSKAINDINSDDYTKAWMVEKITGTIITLNDELFIDMKRRYSKKGFERKMLDGSMTWSWDENGRVVLKDSQKN